MSDPREHPGPSQETDEVAGRPAVAMWVGTILTTAVCTALAFIAIQLAGPSAREAVPRPGGRIGTGQDRGTYTTTAHASRPDSATEARLDGWRWIDRERGVVAVPVAEAMKILAARADSADGGAR